MSYEFGGNTPIDVGDTIEAYNDDGTTVEGKVELTLAVQFLAWLPYNRTRFLFYSDRGVTWQLVSKRNMLPLKRNVLNFPELAERPTS